MITIELQDAETDVNPLVREWLDALRIAASAQECREDDIVQTVFREPAPWVPAGAPWCW